MKITKASHLDHGLTPAHLAFIRERWGKTEAFHIETVELPGDLPSLTCGLHGPIVGDPPVPTSEVAMVQRAGRDWKSRTCARSVRPTRTLTVIVGEHEGEIVLFTAFGGPLAPREPFDPSIPDSELAASMSFWAEHALSVNV